MADYKLALGAEADLLDVARYTVRKWGPEQTRKYEAQLIACFENIASGRSRSRELLKSRPEIRFLRCERHYVFFVKRAAQPVLILAVFHESRDLMARLKERLLS